MIGVDEALKRILAGTVPLEIESVPVTEALGRSLAKPIRAAQTTPAADTSAMDGYAVRAADIATLPASLTVIGEAPAGAPYPGNVSKGEAVRIFTGGIVPDGADTVVIQENTEQKDDAVTILAGAAGANIRKAGLDFTKGDVLLKPGKPLNERDIALAAAGNAGAATVYRKPRVAFLATGNELVAPGGSLKAGSVINTNVPMLTALIASVGAEAIDPGILPDDLKTIQNALKKAKDADVIVTLGGASVGAYDYVLDALKGADGTVDFWKIAMKPGKPLMFGALDATPVIGLPGNPNSAYVGAFLFLLPLLRKLQGHLNPAPDAFPAKAGGPVPAAKDREQFLFATLAFCNEDAGFRATPLPVQDSARISTLQAAHALIRRTPFAPAVSEGDVVEVLPLPTL